MKTILLIGLGRFGRHVAMKLHELNHQVMAVDQDEEKVNRILPYVTSAQIGDSTNEEFLAIPDDEINQKVSTFTKFDSWQAMIDKAAELYALEKMGFKP